MRFCPFCSAENQDAASECAACARRLPPLPPRRRKNGQENTGPVSAATAEAPPADANVAAAEGQELLGNRKKSLADQAPSPAAERREASSAEDSPAGTVDRRRPTATPSARGRRRTMPPIPSRTERDRIAALSTGVAPGLASESIPLPQIKDVSVKALAAKDNADLTPVPSTPSPTPSAKADETPAPAAAPAPAPSDDDGWPAPARKPAGHPDDWTLAKEPHSSAPSPATDSAGTSARTQARAPEPGSASMSNAVTQLAPTTTVSEPFKAPDIAPVPAVPEAGLVAALKYTLSFARARWQRRGAIGDLRDQISKDTGVLDGILGTLGRQTRSLGIENKALESENRAIDGAEDRRKTAEHSCSELSNRQAEENSKFADSEAERLTKMAAADKALEVAQTELGAMEAQRRDLRDQRKTIESRQKGYLKAADGRDADSEKQEITSKRDELRAAAATLRKDAEGLNQEKQDLERRYDAFEQPLGQVSSRVDALKSDRDAAKRGLTDLREGHRHRLAEIDAEQGRKSRELAQAEAEIERRYVTLGTLVNLNRIERSEFVNLYEQIDMLRGAIGARSNEIDKLSAERQAFDKASLIRGGCVLGGAVLLFLALLAILLTAT